MNEGNADKPNLPEVRQEEYGERYASLLGIKPTSLKEMLEIAKLISESDMVPKDFRGKPANVLVAWEIAHALKLSLVQAIQNIALINGRASLWGELGTGIVRAHPLTEYLIMSTIDEVKKTGKAWTKLKRKDQEQVIEYAFSIEEAKTAKLWGKEGPWTQYPYWMLQMRANSFCFKLGASDMLKGLAIAEESGDIIEMVPAGKDIYAMPKKSEPEIQKPKTQILEPEDQEKPSMPLSKISISVEKVTSKDVAGKIYFLVYSKHGEKYTTEHREIAEAARQSIKDGREVELEFEEEAGEKFIHFLNLTRSVEPIKVE